MVEFSIGYIAHNQQIFDTFLSPSISKLKNQIDIIGEKNETNNSASVYNKIVDKAQTQYVLLVHEDVKFEPDFLDAIYKSIMLHPDFGALGIVGFDMNNNTKFGTDVEMYEVERLDACCIVINKQQNLIFDDKTFNELHMYVEDYCMQANQQRHKCYTLLYNWSRNENQGFYHYENTYKKEGNIMWGNYNKYVQIFNKKWSRFW